MLRCPPCTESWEIPRSTFPSPSRSITAAPCVDVVDVRFRQGLLEGGELAMGSKILFDNKTMGLLEEQLSWKTGSKMLQCEGFCNAEWSSILEIHLPFSPDKISSPQSEKNDDRKKNDPSRRTQIRMFSVLKTKFSHSSHNPSSQFFLSKTVFYFTNMQPRTSPTERLVFVRTIPSRENDSLSWER